MNAWTTLGLKRTDDANEIRRAYTRKLKATDIDADPAAFIALRAAFERALADAARQAWAAERAAPTPAFEDEAISISFGPARPREDDPPARAQAVEKAPEPADEAPEPVEGARETAGWAPEAADAAPEIAAEDPHARFTAFNRLLFANASAPPDPAALAQAVRDILDHPDMDRVDHAAQVEEWLAETLFHSIPRSDPVLPMAVARFGWAAELGAARRRPLIAGVAQRAEDLACIERLRKPDHRWHDAYVRLSRPLSGGIGFGDRVRLKPEISQLLNGLRTHYPQVEHSLDAKEVETWDRDIGRKAHLYLGRSDRISWYGWMAVAWVLLNVATLSARAFH